MNYSRKLQDVDPEALYRQSGMRNSSNVYEEDEINYYPAHQYQADPYCGNVRQSGNRPISRQPIPEPLMEYTSYMPNKLQIDSLERDIKCIFEPSCINDANNTVDESYATDDYTKPVLNPEQLLVNNLQKDGRTEFTEEHIIVIDSSDRNIEKYPNPFSYRVYFNSQYNDANIQRKFENVKSIKLETGVLPSRYYFRKTDIVLNPDDENIVRNLKDVSRNQIFTLSHLDPVHNFVVIDVIDVLSSSRYSRKIKFAIETQFPNVVETVYEYIFQFDAISNTLPQNVLNFSESYPQRYSLPSNIFDAHTTYPQHIQKYSLQTYTLERNKFNLLYVDEFEYVNRYSTNDAVAKSFAVLFTDTKCNHSHYVSTKLKEKEFKSQNLATVNRLTVSLRDYTGEQLKCMPDTVYFDYEVPRSKTCTCLTDSNGVFTRDYRCSCTYFRNPLYHHFQNTLMFKVVTWEQDLAKEIF